MERTKFITQEITIPTKELIQDILHEVHPDKQKEKWLESIKDGLSDDDRTYLNIDMRQIDDGALIDELTIRLQHNIISRSHLLDKLIQNL